MPESKRSAGRARKMLVRHAVRRSRQARIVENVETFTICPYCREVVDPHDPTATYAVEQIQYVGSDRRVISRTVLGGYFHAGCSPEAVNFEWRSRPAVSDERSSVRRSAATPSRAAPRSVGAATGSNVRRPGRRTTNVLPSRSTVERGASRIRRFRSAIASSDFARRFSNFLRRPRAAATTLVACEP